MCDYFDMNNNEHIFKYLHFNEVHNKDNWPAALKELSLFVCSSFKKLDVSEFDERFINTAIIRITFSFRGFTLYMPAFDTIELFINYYRRHKKYSCIKKTPPKEYKEISHYFNVLENTPYEEMTEAEELVKVPWKKESKANFVSYWPKEVLDIIKALEVFFKKDKRPLDDNFYTFVSVVLRGISFAAGGRTVYLPSGMSIRIAIRDKLLVMGFNGRNIKGVARKYMVTEQKAYTILENDRNAKFAKAYSTL